MVTHHTISPIAANARGRSHALTRGSRSAASLIAVMDHRSAAAPAAGSPTCSRFHRTRQGTQQNRACSRRGTNAVPHCSQTRSSAIRQCYAGSTEVPNAAERAARTGPFFSFETAGLRPDIVCLSKSIGGYGLPLALTLIRPDFDIWEPGEHNGTFRGVNPAFVTGTAALRTYWRDDALQRSTLAKGQRAAAALAALAQSISGTPIEPRGRGLVHCLAFEDGELAGKVSAAAFERG